MSGGRGSTSRDKRRLGLAEVFIEDGKVVLQLIPPGEQGVTLPMEPEQARELAHGIIQAADELQVTGPLPEPAGEPRDGAAWREGVKRLLREGGVTT